MKNRIEELDSIRGLASLTVFLHHMYAVSVIPLFPFVFELLPLKVLVNGNSAVILFFVLSGFVLFFPFSEGKKVHYGIFLTRRFLRIYVPYLVSILIAMTLATYLSKGSINELSSWFNVSWTSKIDKLSLLEHILLVGNVHTDYFNNVIWSLIHEMRISLFYPLIAYMVLRFKWETNIIICLFLSLIGGTNYYFHFQVSNGYHTTVFDTIHFTSMFVLGSLLANNKDSLIKFYRALIPKIKWTLFFFAFILYNYSGLLIGVTHLPVKFYYNITSDYLITIACIIFILISTSSTKVSSILIKRPIIFLGKISYSLYLYHLIFILSMFHLFYGKMPSWTIFMISLILGFTIASIMYYLVERPTIRLGRRIKPRKIKPNYSKTSA